jgi:hypothetical protein
MRSEHGAASLIVAALIAVAFLLALLVSDVAALVQARARLTTAADAAALAAAPVTFAPFGTAGTPVAEATVFAAANGAVLIECRCPVDRSWASREVAVVVGMSVDLTLLGHREMRAQAAAEFRPVALGH